MESQLLAPLERLCKEFGALLKVYLYGNIEDTF